jgi:hypothetical protein
MSIDGASLPLLIGGGCVLCVVVVVLFFGLQFAGTVVSLISGLVELVSGVFGGNGCCGCIVLLGGLGVCGGLGYGVWSLLQRCGTPQAINLCSLFGR